MKENTANHFPLSGWISSDVIDEQVLSLLEDAIKRGVKIYIGYGFSYPNKKHQMSLKAKEELKSLRNLKQRTINDKNNCISRNLKITQRLL